MLQYKIPQNVGIEDKIVGPFSLRQLIILAVGGGISYVIFIISSRIYELNVLEYIIIALPALFAVALAMIKIHNVSFGKFLLLALEFAIKPKKRHWDHRGISHLVSPDLSEKQKVKVKGKIDEKTEKKKVQSLRKLSRTLDSGGFGHLDITNHEDIDKVKDDDLITEAYFGHKKEESTTENMYWRTRDMQKKKLSILAKIPPKKKEAAPKASEIEQGDATKKSTHEVEVVEKPEVKPVDKPVALEEVVASKPARKRRRKKKLTSQPVREGQVNTLEYKKAATPENSKVTEERKSLQKEKEMSLDELKSGHEIEFNLD